MNKVSDLNKPQSIDDLLTQMACGQYQNLQVFQSRQKRNDRRLPQDFLYVDSQNFGKVGVNAVDYHNGCVTIDISDCQTCLSGTLCIDINQKSDFLMINWQDILDMVKEDLQTCSGRDDLPEFDF